MIIFNEPLGGDERHVVADSCRLGLESTEQVGRVVLILYIWVFHTTIDIAMKTQFKQQIAITFRCLTKKIVV